MNEADRWGAKSDVGKCIKSLNSHFALESEVDKLLIIKADLPLGVTNLAGSRKKLTGLKISGDSEEFETGLDASFIDVYKGCHGAILVFDITKPWTFDYVKKEVPEIPSHIPVLILANFTDASHHRQVTQLQIADFVENLSRDGKDVAEVGHLSNFIIYFFSLFRFDGEKPV